MIRGAYHCYSDGVVEFFGVKGYVKGGEQYITTPRGAEQLVSSIPDIMPRVRKALFKRPIQTWRTEDVALLVGPVQAATLFTRGLIAVGNLAAATDGVDFVDVHGATLVGDYVVMVRVQKKAPKQQVALISAHTGAILP